jgi:hypothetical protein
MPHRSDRFSRLAQSIGQSSNHFLKRREAAHHPTLLRCFFGQRENTCEDEETKEVEPGGGSYSHPRRPADSSIRFSHRIGITSDGGKCGGIERQSYTILIVFTTSRAIITRPVALPRCIQSLIAVPFFPSFVPEVIHALITSLPALRGVKDEKRSIQRHLKKNSNEKTSLTIAKQRTKCVTSTTRTRLTGPSRNPCRREDPRLRYRLVSAAVPSGWASIPGSASVE